MLGYQDIDHTVAVLFGGRSTEHDISLRSAVYILRNLPEHYRIIPVCITRAGAFLSLEGCFSPSAFANVTPDCLKELSEGHTPASFPKSNVVRTVILPQPRETIVQVADAESPVRILNLEANIFFPVLHGTNGEDGRLQGVFELAEVAYVGCDLRASALGIDKNLQKIIARSAHIPVVRFELVEVEEWQAKKQKLADRIADSLGFPCFVKPNSLGSSIGVARATGLSELRDAVDAALRYDDKVLVEEAITGSEVECAFLGTGCDPRVSTPGEIRPKSFYSFEEKYVDSDSASLFIPANLEKDRMGELRVLAQRVARALSLEGLSRIDFWNCTKTGTFIFNEVNTLPGLTSISMFPKLWEFDGASPQTWISELVERAIRRQRRQKELLLTSS